MKWSTLKLNYKTLAFKIDSCDFTSKIGSVPFIFIYAAIVTNVWRPMSNNNKKKLFKGRNLDLISDSKITKHVCIEANQTASWNAVACIYNKGKHSSLKDKTRCETWRDSSIGPVSCRLSHQERRWAANQQKITFFISSLNSACLVSAAGLPQQCKDMTDITV